VIAILSQVGWATNEMTDLFLERRVRDLAAAAQHEVESRSYEAALETYRTALAAVDGALSLDPSNQTAARLRQELTEAMARVPEPAYTNAVQVRTQASAAGVKPPSFDLLREGDVPLFENAEDMLGGGRGGYLPEAETFSILDTNPHPAKRDFLPLLAAILGILLLGMAVRVIWYYSTNRVDLGASPLKYAEPTQPVQPAAPAESQASADDDTLYFAPPDVSLPVLLSKTEPKADSAGKVALLVVIDPTGKPVGARVWQGLDPDLNVLAIQAAGRWRFRPATKNGRPVPVTAQLEVSFRQP
jgi:TonB family protein